MKVSVIVPVFRVEQYIERCVRSLMEQTFDDVEFIFVDDASPDQSMEIVKRVTGEYHRNVRFLVHEKNRGLPAARNTGLEAAQGEFIYHCDSDDWPEPTMLEKMVGAADAVGADFAYCDYYLSFANKERWVYQPTYSDSMEMLERGFLAGMIKYNVWNKLVRRRLYLDYGLRSPEKHNKGGEDLMMVKVLRMANKVIHVPEALYHYNRTNDNAITKTRSEKHFLDIKANSDDVIQYLTQHAIPHPEYLEFFKLNQKLPFLFSQNRHQYQLWREWYPEANSFIHLNKEWPFRTRMVQHWAKLHLFLLVRMYGWTVDHLFYGLLFRR